MAITNTLGEALVVHVHVVAGMQDGTCAVRLQ